MEPSAADSIVRRMDMTAITELKSRAIQAMASAEKYRKLAERPGLRDFYRALAFTHERMAREATLMIDQAERLVDLPAQAAA